MIINGQPCLISLGYSIYWFPAPASQFGIVGDLAFHWQRDIFFRIKRWANECFDSMASYVQEYLRRHLIWVQMVHLCQRGLLAQLTKKKPQQRITFIRLAQMVLVQVCFPEMSECLMPVMMSTGELWLIRIDYRLIQMPLLHCSNFPFHTGKWR